MERKATWCARCSFWDLPIEARWATIFRHPSCALIRLLIQVDICSWTPRMVGIKSIPWILGTIEVGIDCAWTCWANCSSRRGLLSTIWLSGSSPWRLITCVVYLEWWTSAQWGQGWRASSTDVYLDTVDANPFALWPLSRVGHQRHPHALDPVSRCYIYHTLTERSFTICDT